MSNSREIKGDILFALLIRRSDVGDGSSFDDERVFDKTNASRNDELKTGDKREEVPLSDSASYSMSLLLR